MECNNTSTTDSFVIVNTIVWKGALKYGNYLGTSVSSLNQEIQLYSGNFGKTYMLYYLNKDCTSLLLY